MAELRPYQVEAVKDILDKKRLLIADDMGLGKTAEAIAAKTAIERRQGYDARTLVVCPASVAEHWEREAKAWYKKREYTNVARIQTSTFDSDVANAANADFIVVGYPTLSYFGKDTSKIGMLEALGFQYGIIDEAHNAKNPDSIRSMAVKRIFDSMDYLAILSGTPIPNSVIDIYMLLSLLDNGSFPINVENSSSTLSSFYGMFRKDPEFVRKVLNDRMLRRTVQDYLNLRFPDLREQTIKVELEGEHRDVYLQVYENEDVRPGSKLIQLIKASIDPNLVEPSLLCNRLAARVGRMQSSVYASLDDLVQRVADSNGKVLIFSDLKQGVTVNLQERYSMYGAVFIDGDVTSASYDNSTSERESIRKRFQNNPDCKVLISTTVMDEGVDLSAATDVVHLTLPYTPATYDQRNRRSQRIGEIAKDYTTSHIVMPYIDEATPIITEGIRRLLDDKRRIITYIQQQPFSLTNEDIEQIRNGFTEDSKQLLPALRSPMQSIISHFGQLKGQGHKKISGHYRKYQEEAEFISKLYSSHWEGYYGGNTATLYAKVICALEQKEDLERKLDIASGPFSLSRRIKEPVTNLDLNPYMIEAGRILERDGTVVSGNIAVRGSFHQLPFNDGTYDFTLCSLALHMSRHSPSTSTDMAEREQVFREMNRVLREGGYALITLPNTVIAEEDFENFYDGMELLGFEVLPFSGFFRGPGDSKFRVYLGAFRKISESYDDTIGKEFFTWKMDKKTLGGSGGSSKKRKHIFAEPKEIEREFVDEFYHTRRGMKLEDMLVF